MYPTPEMIREAAVTLRGVARQTPVLPFGRQGGTLFLKAENLQETGSFKIRGAYNKLSSLTAEEASRGAPSGTKLLAEGAGATPVAACVYNRIDTVLKTMAVVSGGNMDIRALAQVVAKAAETVPEQT